MPHDLIISAGQFALIVAPLLMLVRQTKVPLSSSILCAVVLFVFAFTFADLGLWLSFASSALGGSVWALLGIQTLGQDAPKPVSDSYWYELQIDRAHRPAHASLLFNFTKAQTAVVWTQSWEENLGVVVLGSVPPAPWTPEDDIRVIGYMSADAMKELTPRPAAVPSGK